MRFCVYAQWAKARHFTEAVIAGFPGRVRDIKPGNLAKDCIHVIGGLQFGALELMKEIRANGEQYVFFDRAYFGGGSYTDRIRMTMNGYQKHWIDAPRTGRLLKWGVEIAPWNDDGDFVMVVPPSQAVQSLFGIHGWLEKTLESLRGCVRRIVVSPKDDRQKSPLRERLKGCHAVLTWTSNVAVEAILDGVPAFVSPYSAARPVAGNLEHLNLDEPVRTAREKWAESLGWGQFTIEEIASGFAREHLLQSWRPDVPA